MTTAETLIDRSVSHTEITWADWTAELADELAALSDGSVEANGVVEFWADDPANDTDMLWRVHLRCGRCPGCEGPAPAGETCAACLADGTGPDDHGWGDAGPSYTDGES